MNWVVVVGLVQDKYFTMCTCNHMHIIELLAEWVWSQDTGDRRILKRIK